MNWEEGIDVAKAINNVIDSIANEVVNDHNCHLHNSIVACNNQNKFRIAVMDSKKRLLNVLTR